MAKTTAKSTEPAPFQATFQAISVQDVRAYFSSVDAPDASGNNNNDVSGSLEIILDPDVPNPFQAGGEYIVTIAPKPPVAA